MSRRRLALLAGAAAIVAAAAAACDSAEVHILSGQLFDAQRDCLGDVSAIDVVNGPSTGETCNECLVVGAGDAQSVYVTGTCPPYAPDFAAETPDMARDAADPCFGAFAAQEAGTKCSAFGDAGTADAGGDGATADAGGDAATMDAGGDAAPGDAGGDASPADAGTGGNDAGGADGSADAPAD